MIKNFGKLHPATQAQLLTELNALATQSSLQEPSNGYADSIGAKRLFNSTLLKHPFLKACLETSLKTNPLHLHGDDERRFQALMAQALECRPSREAVQQAGYEQIFTSPLGDNFLRIAVHTMRSGEHTRKNYDFLIDESTPGMFVLKPHVADAVEILARECLEKHAHLIGRNASTLQLFAKNSPSPTAPSAPATSGDATAQR